MKSNEKVVKVMVKIRHVLFVGLFSILCDSTDSKEAICPRIRWRLKFYSGREWRTETKVMPGCAAASVAKTVSSCLERSDQGA